MQECRNPINQHRHEDEEASLCYALEDSDRNSENEGAPEADEEEEEDDAFVPSDQISDQII